MKKIVFAVIVLMVVSLLLAGCGQQGNPDIAVIVALTQTAAAQGEVVAEVPEVTEPVQASAVISGIVQSQAPPTPPMTVYALDSATGEWFSAETAQSNSPVPFTLRVSPGHYQVFAFSASGAGFGYPSEDGWQLAVIAVSDGQTVNDVLVSPPSQCECGSMFGLPASPDGRFAAIPGPAEECKASVVAAMQSSESAAVGAVDVSTLTQAAPQRVQFAAGASSARIESVVQPGVCSLFLLGAQQGQGMDVKLAPAGSVSLGAWGVDGSILLSSAAGENEYHDVLPFTQDYMLEICPMNNSSVSYTLDIYIAPLDETMTASANIAYPFVEPFDTADMQTLMAYGVPQILPPSFPGASAADPVVPYFLTNNSGEFEVSLDYGSECNGAGACHYGIYSGKYVGANTWPISTANIYYDSSVAESFALYRSITGFYVPSACGANCSDAMIFFIYDEYQYVLGMKAASREQIAALANDAINNSIP